MERESVGVTWRRPEGGPLEILRDQDYAFIVDIYSEDLPGALSSTTVKIDKPGGSAVVASTVVTPSTGPEASSNRLSYTFLTAANDTLGESFTVTWTATVAGRVYLHREVFDVVRTQLVNTVTEEDLFERCPTLRDQRSLGLTTGLADSGTDTTIVDDQLKQQPDDFYNGGVVTVIDGTNEGETRYISDFTRSSGTVTVGESFPAANDVTTRYEVRRSWAPIITKAFEEIRWAIRTQGGRPALIVDAGELNAGVEYLSAALAFESIPKGGVDGDNWLLAQEYRKRFRDWYGETDFRYDVSEDGAVDSVISASNVRVRRR